MVVGLLILVGAVWGAVAVYRSLFPKTPNYAQEVAEPFEKGLMARGASRVSSGGDAGRGLDNREPYYDATFRLAGTRDRAEELVSAVAKEDGYTLTHASPQSRGHLDAVADIYINDWYFDITSKKSTFPDLQDGPVKFAVQLGEEEPHYTAIRIQVRLPLSKP